MEDTRPELTIETLNVQFDVSADGQEREFAQLFRKYIEIFARDQAASKRLSEQLENDRLLRFEGGSGW